MAKIIGLTGSFGTGKTFVASIFKSCGARVIDADRIAHDAIKKGRPAYDKIKAVFGPAVIGRSGEIDRKRLASIVFSDKKALDRLNSMIHPEVVRDIKKKIRTAGKDAVVVIDAPLLIEADLLNIVDKLVVVQCSKKRQIERCIKKFCIKKEEVLKRIKNQMSMERKLKMADFVVRNDRTKAATRKQARKIWGEIVWR